MEKKQIIFSSISIGLLSVGGLSLAEASHTQSVEASICPPTISAQNICTEFKNTQLEAELRNNENIFWASGYIMVLVGIYGLANVALNAVSEKDESESSHRNSFLHAQRTIWHKSVYQQPSYRPRNWVNNPK